MSKRIPRITKAVRSVEAAFKPIVQFSPVMVPQGNGDFLVKPGKPILLERDAEISTGEFAKISGLSQRHITTMCGEGTIKARKRTPYFKSEWVIPVTELQRFLGELESQERQP